MTWNSPPRINDTDTEDRFWYWVWVPMGDHPPLLELLSYSNQDHTVWAFIYWEVSA